eukprot:4417864-Prymnesium_polylepis.2
MKELLQGGRPRVPGAHLRDARQAAVPRGEAYLAPGVSEHAFERVLRHRRLHGANLATARVHALTHWDRTPDVCMLDRAWPRRVCCASPTRAPS